MAFFKVKEAREALKWQWLLSDGVDPEKYEFIQTLDFNDPDY